MNFCQNRRARPGPTDGPGCRFNLKKRFCCRFAVFTPTINNCYNFALRLCGNPGRRRGAYRRGPMQHRGLRLIAPRGRGIEPGQSRRPVRRPSVQALRLSLFEESALNGLQRAISLSAQTLCFFRFGTRLALSPPCAFSVTVRRQQRSASSQRIRP
jgi:hypothetical protein